mmetsp:Transcript_46026/g.62601  ORF Transcript_46026/g.62601 Transcript_46026/m.62601 type:complete len:86 (+) Transcript_46026:400-657(+)
MIGGVGGGSTRKSLFADETDNRWEGSSAGSKNSWKEMISGEETPEASRLQRRKKKDGNRSIFSGFIDRERIPKLKGAGMVGRKAA